MSDTTPNTTNPRNKAAVLCGLSGFGVGVIGLAVDAAALGLGAGVLALIAPMIAVAGSPKSSNEIADASTMTDPVFPIADIDFESAADSKASPFHEESGLLTAEYFRLAVQTRVTAARRFLKPLAVVNLKVQGPEGDRPTSNLHIAEAVAKELRDCDTACVLSGNAIGIVMEDTSENGAIWAVERLRRSLAESHPDVNVWAGIACYPAHAMEADEVMQQAEAALARAEEWPQHRIEVAHAE
jgi:hypothetical protein